MGAISRVAPVRPTGASTTGRIVLTASKCNGSASASCTHCLACPGCDEVQVTAKQTCRQFKHMMLKKDGVRMQKMKDIGKLPETANKKPAAA